MALSEADVFSMGFKLGFENPEAQPAAPFDEPYRTYYEEGVMAGRSVREGEDAAYWDSYEGPTIGPDPGGETWEHYQKRYHDFFEAFFHKHMPHTEVEMEVPEPPPVNVTR